MKNVIKLIPQYALIICAYILLAASFLEVESDTLITVLEIVLLALWTLNFVYSVLLVIFMKDVGRSFLITVLAAKILLIPAFVILFICGAVTVLGIFIAPMVSVLLALGVAFFVFGSYCLMLSAAVYSVGGMIKFYKNNKSTFLLVLTAVCCVCQFIFVADVISLFAYVLLAKGKKTDPQLYDI